MAAYCAIRRVKVNDQLSQPSEMTNNLARSLSEAVSNV